MPPNRRNANTPLPQTSRSTPIRPTRTSRVNPFQNETPTALQLRLKNEARNMRTLQRLEALHRGELPMPSSSQALRAHLAALELANNSQSTQNNEAPNEPLHDPPQTQLWDDFDSSNWQTYKDPPTQGISTLSQRVYHLNACRRRQRLLNNWNQTIPQLHGVYMYLKVKTGNWTFNNCFESFEDQFCQCTSFKNQTIDFFDLMERSEVLLNAEGTKRRELRQCFSAAVNIFHTMLLKTRETVDSALQLTKTQIQARWSCPGYFGPNSPEDTYQPMSLVKDSLVVCLDGNFQHRHNAKAGLAAPLVIPPIFLETERVNQVRELINNLADTDEPMSLSIVYPGEQRCLPLAILEKLFEDVELSRPVGVLYDIGCSLKKFLDLREYFMFSAKKEHLKFGTLVFHAYVHEWKCQVKFNPRFNVGWGMSDGEGLERLWSLLAPLVRTLRYSSRNHWKYTIAKIRRRKEHDTLTNLLQQPNPFVNNGTNYTLFFFTAQWEEQLTYLENITQEETDRQKRLTKLLEKEEALNKLQKVLERKDWDIQAKLIERIAEEISKTEESQKELAQQLGISYTSQSTNVDKEKRLLLVRSAKQGIYVKAVNIMGIRQPIVESQTRGKRVGTKLKEKIYEAIKKKKAVVLRIITKYKNQQKDYLKNYDHKVLASFVLLTWDTFVSLKLDDPFWNDAADCNSKEPWAVASDVREGIRACHMIDRTEEELDLIAQELGRAMSWAVEMHNMLSTLATNINNLPPDSTKVVTPTQLGTLDQFTGQQVLKFELHMQLANHNEMMRFNLDPATFMQAQPEVDGGAEEIDETLQEQEFVEAADDGEFADDSQVDQMLEDEGW
ncbi:hypothetical protein PCASD_03389 [Puccinia coronata f. sp. avenae]|uniref:CxC1-like cysteine cluster associated with KDZ transposases domain-containing protein n=1 Tax=Puccinia coronata f. sp. avenae TaxID=200324 RepID=A0A2N5VFC9_9BASI|nr:hypothetical protein PCASD_03389 [Puccinia coronata f. sp. avenae]